jgi:DNA-binding CsgD family transcriptional regulator
VHLLLVRARQHGNRFTVTRANFARVAELCRELGGLPLALELAAARLSTRAIPLFATDLGGQPLDRERIISGALDWSHDQLTHSQQILFRRLSVFAGSWGVAAASSIAGGEGLPPRAIPSTLEGLIKAALVVQDPAQVGTRYRLLDVVRDYALDKLRASGEEDSQRCHFAVHMLELAEQVPPEALSSAHALLLEAEIDNLRAALAWTIRAGDAERAMRLATAGCSLWYFRGHYAEGCEWLERALRLRSPTTLRARARATAWLGLLLQFQGQYGSAERWLTHAVELHEASDDARGAAVASAMLAQLSLMRGDVARGLTLCSKAAERLEELGMPAHVASQIQVGVAAIELGDFERAATVVRRCKARDLDAHGALGAWLRFLEGRLATASGELELAQTYLVQALDVSRELHEQTAVITALVELGNVELERNATPAARHAFAEAIELARRSGERIQLARALEGIGCALSADRPSLAVRLVSAASRLRSLMNARPWPRDRRRVAEWLPKMKRTLLSDDYRSAWDEGRSTDTEQAASLVRALSAGSNPRETSTPSFTPRERQILALLARALTNEQIALQLAIRPATARTHVERVMLKLGLHRRAELVLWAIQHSAEATSPRVVSRSGGRPR